jgi:hypothetical protein
MRNKDFIWIAVLVVLAGVYAVFFSHWFDKRQMAINASIRPSRRTDATVFPVVFTLNADFRLTSVEVIPMTGDKFDPTATPVWHLVSDSNSVPTHAIRYGQNIGGMKPALKGVRPEALTPGVIYRAIVSAGDISAYTDFKTQFIHE